jgi:phenylacetate-CoA ligase
MTSKKPLPGDLEAIETASRDEISALQLERLKWSLRHTYDNVEPYRKKCLEKGVHPDDLKCLSDLGKFPFMTKLDLRDNYPFGLFAVPRDKVARLHASSGTTGKSVVVGYTRNDIENWSNVVARSLRAAGVRAGDMVHNAYGYGMFTGGLGAHFGIEAAGCCAVPMSGGQTEKQVQQIMDFKPEAIMVTPSYSLVIAEEFERLGINPETGEVLPDGEEGELVFTSLTKEAFPVIRYRTRDLTRLLPPTARSFRRIGKITGRSDDMLIVRGVNVFPTQIEEQIMRDPRLSGNYQIMLSRDGHMDNVEIRCEVQRELSGKLSANDIQAISKSLQQHIKTIIGISTRVTIMEHDSIPRTLTGKAKRVLDERPKQI